MPKLWPHTLTHPCVKYGENHTSCSCKKSPELPAKCGLCHGAHPTNYKECTLHQTISRKHNTSSKKAHLSPPHTQVTYVCKFNWGSQSANLNTPTNINETSIQKFLVELISIINPLTSLLTTVHSNLINTNNAK